MATEVDAFSSVQDMIHAAILSYGSRATLREVSPAGGRGGPCRAAPLPFARQLRACSPQ
jgi:hypothetical protein